MRPDSPSREADLQEWKSEMQKLVQVEVQDSIKSALATALPTFMANLQQHIEGLGAKLLADLTPQLETLVTKAVEAKLASKFQTVDETMRAGLEVLENNISKSVLRVDALERKLRSPNALLFGVVESVGEVQLQEVKSLLGTATIKESVRLGKPQTNAKRPRPVLIRFDTVADKHAAYKKAKELRQRYNVSMDDDLTPLQQEARDRLKPLAAALRTEGCKTFWRGEHLFKIQGSGSPIKVAPGTTVAGPSSTPA